MAGLYIHIPFCKSNCSYCDFYKTTNINLKNDFIESLKLEIDYRSGFFNDDIIRTLYFGGGTPSVLSIDEFSTIMDSLSTVFNLNSVEEFTVEINPDDVTVEYLQGLKNLGVNRISYGVQSFHNSHLAMVKRRHNSQQAIDSVRIAKSVGIDNISIDLIYGLPGMSESEWRINIEKFISLDVPHLSAYHLIYEKGTLITSQVKKGIIKEAAEDDSNNQFLMLRQMLSENGYEHYEISNFSKPGKESKHNSSYWSGDRYLGLGPSSHSFDGENRFWNVSNLKKYELGLNSGDGSFYENEHLSEFDIYNELIMLGLRTKSGVSFKKLKNVVSDKFINYFLKLVSIKIATGEIINEDDRYYISEDSFLISDKIMSDLFYVV